MTAARFNGPAGLHRRGKALWSEVTRERTLTPAERVLLEEACRTADRLDTLHGILTSRKTWMTLSEQWSDDGTSVQVTVTVDSVLSESRQQMNALRLAIVSLGLTKVPVAAPLDQPQGPALDPADEIARRRAARDAAT